jgi:hypothetical protein
LTVVRGRAPEGWRAWTFAVEILHYQRSNQLHVNAMSLSLGRQL